MVMKRKYKKPVWLNEKNHKEVKVGASQMGLNMEEFIQILVSKNKKEKKDKFDFINF